MKWINIGILVFFAIIMFYTAHCLNGWNEEHLDTCCINMCGRTTSWDECFPQLIVVMLVCFGIAFLILAFFNWLDIEKIVKG